MEEVERAGERHRLFSRGLDDQAMEPLLTAAKTERWLRDVLADKSLMIGIRERTLDVYYQGQTVFHVSLTSSGVVADTHEKYLIDPKLASRVELRGKEFMLKKLLDDGLIRSYEGTSTLNKMKVAAAYYAGDEKVGCHEIALHNSCVVDCEVAFPRFLDSDGSAIKAGRLDLVTIVPDGDRARLMFWEAKLFSNGDLRANLGKPEAVAPVHGQIRRYQTWITDNRQALVETYTRVARNLVQLADAGWSRKPTRTIKAVASGRMELVCGPELESTVGLLVFGFDQDQRDGDLWHKHLARLQNGALRVIAMGDANGIKLG